MGNEQSYQQNQASNGLVRSRPPKPILRRHQMSQSQSMDDTGGQLHRSVVFRDQTEDAMRSGSYQKSAPLSAQPRSPSLATTSGVEIGGNSTVTTTTNLKSTSINKPAHQKGRAPPPPPTQETAPRLPKMDRHTQDEIRNRARNIASSRPASDIEQRVDQRRKFDMTNFKVELAEAAARVRERQLTASAGGATEAQRPPQSRTRPVKFPMAPQSATGPPIKLFDPSRQDAISEASSVPSSISTPLPPQMPSQPSPQHPVWLPSQKPQKPQQPKLTVRIDSEQNKTPRNGQLERQERQQQPQQQHQLLAQPPQVKPKPSTAALKEELKQEILMELLKTVSGSPSDTEKDADPLSERSVDAAAPLSKADRHRLVEEIRREVLLSSQPKANEADRAANTVRRQYEEASAAYYSPYMPQPPPMMEMQSRAESEYNQYYGIQSHYQPYMQVQHQMPPPPYQAAGIYPHYTGTPPLVTHTQYPQQYQSMYQYDHRPQIQQHPAVLMRHYGFLSPPRPHQSQWGPINGYSGAPPRNEEAHLGSMQSPYDERHRQPAFNGRNEGTGDGTVSGIGIGSSKRRQFSDSWKRMTNSLRRAFGEGGAGGDSSSAGGVRRRSSVRDATFDQQTISRENDSFDRFSSRSGSMYDLSGVEMPVEDADYADDRRRSRSKHSRRLSSSHQGNNKASEEEIWHHVARASHDSLRKSYPSATYSFSVDEAANRNNEEGILRRRIVQTTAEEESVAEERRTVVTLQQRRRTTATAAAKSKEEPTVQEHQLQQQDYRIPRAAAGLGQFMQSEQTRF